MADRGKFAADPSRVLSAEAGMEGIADFVRGIFQNFSDATGYKDFLYNDETGEALQHQLRQQHEQFGQAGEALVEAFEAVPNMLQKQGRYLQKSQFGVIDSIHESSVRQPGVHGGER
jgi:hypothetical protein